MQHALLDLLTAHRSGHTDFQVDHFIVQKAGACDLWGMYQQALRELETRAVTMAEAFAGSTGGGVTYLAGKKWRDRLREFVRFYNHALGLHEHFERLFADDVAGELRAATERDSWLSRLRMTAALDLRTTGRIQGPLWELLPTLPKSMRLALFEDFTDPPRLLDWHEQHIRNGAPEIPEPSTPLSLSSAASIIEQVRPYVLESHAGDRLQGSERDSDAPGDLLGDPADAQPDRGHLPPHGSPARADAWRRPTDLPAAGF